MALTKKQIIEFQTLYLNRFGKKINEAEAYEKGVALLRLVELLYRPMAEKEYNQLQKRRRETSDLQ